MSNIVTLEQAKRLKKLGFNRQVFTYWELEDEIWVMTRTLNPDFEKGFIEYPEEGCIIIPAPTIPEALDWIREEKGIHCGVFVNTDSFTTWYSYRAIKNNLEIIRDADFDTHHLAESALLDAVLTYLENKGGE